MTETTMRLVVDLDGVQDVRLTGTAEAGERMAARLLVLHPTAEWVRVELASGLSFTVERE